MSSMQQNAQGATAPGMQPGTPPGQPSQEQEAVNQLAQILGVTPEQAQKIIQMLPQICGAMQQAGAQPGAQAGGEQQIPTTPPEGQGSTLFNESRFSNDQMGTMRGMNGTGPTPGYGQGMGGPRQGMGMTPQQGMGINGAQEISPEVIMQYVQEMLASGMTPEEITGEIVNYMLESGAISEEDAAGLFQTTLEMIAEIGGTNITSPRPQRKPEPDMVAMPDSRKVNFPWRDSIANDRLEYLQRLLRKLYRNQLPWNAGGAPYNPLTNPRPPDNRLSIFLDPRWLTYPAFTPQYNIPSYRQAAPVYPQRTPSGYMPSFRNDSKDKPLIFNDSIELHIETDSIKENEGMLMAKVVATSAMIQDYNGKKVLKHPDHLKKAIDFCRSIPITDQHPQAKIVMSQDEIKGWTSEPIWDAKNNQIHFSIMVMDQKLINKIKGGNTDVSVGFFCDLDETPGTYNDAKYDAVQTNIVMNHLAAGLKPGDGRCPTGTCGVILGEPELDSIEDGKDCDTCGKVKNGPDCCITIAKSKAPNSNTKKTEQEDKSMTEEKTNDTVQNDKPKEEVEPKTEEKKEEIVEEDETKNEEKTKLVDSIMDNEPPKPREHYEKMSLDSLTAVNEILSSQKSTNMSGSSTRKKAKVSIDDAYAEMEEKLRS